MARTSAKIGSGYCILKVEYICFLPAVTNPLAEGLDGGARAWCGRKQEVQGVLEQAVLKEGLLEKKLLTDKASFLQ